MKSILSQIYSNWSLFVTGDKYANKTKFRSLFSSIPSSKLFLHNLPEAEEQTKLTRFKLWESGGVTAMNDALSRGEKHHNNCGSDCDIYVTNLDDYDTLSSEYLAELLSI